MSYYLTLSAEFPVKKGVTEQQLLAFLKENCHDTSALCGGDGFDYDVTNSMLFIHFSDDVSYSSEINKELQALANAFADWTRGTLLVSSEDHDENESYEQCYGPALAVYAKVITEREQQLAALEEVVVGLYKEQEEAKQAKQPAMLALDYA